MCPNIISGCLEVLFPPLLLHVCEFSNFLFFFLQLAYSLREAVYFGVTHFVHVLCENCEKWLGPSGLWCLLGDRKRKWMNPGASHPHTPRKAAALGLWTCSFNRRPTLSTWRKFFRIKAMNLCSPWSLAEGIYLEHIPQRDCSSRGGLLPVQRRKNQERAFPLRLRT